MVLGLLCAALAPSGDARAHASLVRAEPADGQVLTAPPEQLSLTFNEPVSPLVLKLVRPDGTAAALDRYMMRGATIDIEPPRGLGDGTHVLSWRVISEDGHPVGGAVVFSVGAPSAGTVPTAEPVTDELVRVALWIMRVALLAGLFLGTGGAFYRSWIAAGAPTGSRFVGGALGVGLVAAPLSVGLQGLDALGLPLAGLARPVAWATGWSTSHGTTALAAACALGVGLTATSVARAATGKALSLLAILGAGLALAASGHAAAAGPPWLTRTAVFLHGAGIAFWTGALVPLALRRFSRVIPGILIVLSVAGIVLAVVQVADPVALWTTDYGRVLLGKLALVLALFGLAAINRWRLTTPVVQNGPGAAGRLARAIVVETALVIAVFGVAALWRFTPPPHALAAAAAEPATVHLQNAQAMADLLIAPGRAGRVTVSMAIMTGDFGALNAREVTLVLAHPAAGIEPIRRLARRPGDATWRIDDLVIPVPGRWSVRIDILVSDFELVKLEGTVDIRR